MAEIKLSGEKGISSRTQKKHKKTMDYTKPEMTINRVFMETHARYTYLLKKVVVCAPLLYDLCLCVYIHMWG